jgi:hypothetical protein
VVST